MHIFTVHMSLELYEFAALLAGAQIEIEEVLNEYLRSEENAYSSLQHYFLPQLRHDCPHDAEILDRCVIQVSLNVNNKLWLQALDNFIPDGFASAEDYLLGLLHGRLMEAMTNYDDDQGLGGNDWRPLWLQALIRASGGYDIFQDFEDDDDFPF
jgi:hypothetical protein